MGQNGQNWTKWKLKSVSPLMFVYNSWTGTHIASHTCKISILEAETGGSWISSQLGLIVKSGLTNETTVIQSTTHWSAFSTNGKFVCVLGWGLGGQCWFCYLHFFWNIYLWRSNSTQNSCILCVCLSKVGTWTVMSWDSGKEGFLQTLSTSHRTIVK